MPDKLVAIYIRLSAEDKDVDGIEKAESYSISNQRKLIKGFLESHKELAGSKTSEFVDDGFTGTDFERPQFKNMMLQAKSGNIGCIVFKDLSRLGRQYLDVSSYLEHIFPLLGIRIISVNDSFDSNDYIGTTGGLELALRNLINGMYSQDLSVKVKSALRTRHLRGEHTGGHPFYGYKKDLNDKHKLIVDEDIRDNITLIFQLCIEGLPARAIARYLNERDLLCPAEYRKSLGVAYNKPFTEDHASWIPSTVLKIIKDERYTGKMVSGTSKSVRVGSNEIVFTEKKDWIITPGTHEAIVSEEIYQLANQALATRIRTINQNTSWKNSKNLFVCGHCGRRLQKSNGKKTHLYCIKASTVSESECSQMHIDLIDLESEVLTVVKSLGNVLTDGVKIIKKQRDKEDRVLQEKIGTSKRAISKIKEQKTYLYEQYRNGTLSRESFVEMQERNAKEVDRFSSQVIQLELQLQQEINDRQILLSIDEEIRGVDIISHYDPAAISKVVERVIVYSENKVEVVFKNQDAIRRLLETREDHVS